MTSAVNRLANAIDLPFDAALAQQSLQIAEEITNISIKQNIDPRVFLLSVTAVNIASLGQILSQKTELDAGLAHDMFLQVIDAEVKKVTQSFSVMEKLVAALGLAQIGGAPGLAMASMELDAQRAVLQAAVDGTACPGCGEIHEVTDEEREEFRRELNNITN